MTKQKSRVASLMLVVVVVMSLLAMLATADDRLYKRWETKWKNTGTAPVFSHEGPMVVTVPLTSAPDSEDAVILVGNIKISMKPLIKDGVKLLSVTPPGQRGKQAWIARVNPTNGDIIWLQATMNFSSSIDDLVYGVCGGLGSDGRGYVTMMGRDGDEDTGTGAMVWKFLASTGELITKDNWPRRSSITQLRSAYARTCHWINGTDEPILLLSQESVLGYYAELKWSNHTFPSGAPPSLSIYTEYSNILVKGWNENLKGDHLVHSAGQALSAVPGTPTKTLMWSGVDNLMTNVQWGKFDVDTMTFDRTSTVMLNSTVTPQYPVGYMRNSRITALSDTTAFISFCFRTNMTLPLVNGSSVTCEYRTTKSQFWEQHAMGKFDFVTGKWMWARCLPSIWATDTVYYHAFSIMSLNQLVLQIEYQYMTTFCGKRLLMEGVEKTDIATVLMNPHDGSCTTAVQWGTVNDAQNTGDDTVDSVAADHDGNLYVMTKADVTEQFTTSITTMIKYDRCYCAHGACKEFEAKCVCDEGYYGQHCDQQCSCNGHGICDATGACMCANGWTGDYCGIAVSNCGQDSPAATTTAVISTTAWFLSFIPMLRN